MNENSNGILKFGKKFLLWFLCIFLITAALAFMPSVGSFILIIAAILVAPIEKWQKMLSTVFKAGKIKTIFVTILSIVGIGIAGNSAPDTPAADTSNSGVEIVEQTSATTTAPITEEVITTTSYDDTQITTTYTNEISQTQTVIAEFVPPEIVENSTFEIHFIDVGQADAALILCDGEAMLIDGGNVSDSSLMYSYLKNQNVPHLEYVVATHAHEDHIGGLAGALNYADADMVLCPVTEYNSEVFADFKKYAKNITVPKINDKYALGSAEFTILALNSADDVNETSIVLRLTYGQTSFVFAGDAERETEQAVLNAGFNIESTLLKVGHHGSDSSTSYVFLREIMPKYAVISVGDDNSYGHPTDAVLSRLSDADVKVYRTDLDGTIICYSDGTQLTFKTNPSSKPQQTTTTTTTTKATTTVQTTPPTTTIKPTTTQTTIQTTTTATQNNEWHYILNTNSMKIHYPSCSSVDTMAEHNKQEYTGTREYLISIGYTPCGRCKP